MATSNSIITLRRHDMDNVRSFLTGLVVVHHTAMVYGGPGLGHFHSRLFPDSFVSPTLFAFNAFNQSFFMGLFFWLSGRVSAQSLHRLDEQGRSRKHFVRSKALRLAIPAIFYTLVVNPFVRAVALPEWTGASFQACLGEYFSTLRGIRGPVWYTATLFVSDLVAALVKPTLAPSDDSSEKTADVKASPGVTEKHVGYKTLENWGWLAVAASCFLIRLRYPTGTLIMPLAIQPGYAAQYIFAYAMGHLSFQYSQPRFSGPFPQLGLGSATAISLLSHPLLYFPSYLRNPSHWVGQTLSNCLGGWNLSAAAYAFWNEFSFALVGPALMKHFQEWHSGPAVSWLWQPRYSYAAFMIHMLVSTAMEVKVDSLLLASPGVSSWFQTSLGRLLGPVVLTGLVGAINTVASFALGRLAVDYIPGLGSIL